MTDRKHTEVLRRELRVLAEDVVAAPDALTRILAERQRSHRRRAAPLIAAAAVVLVAAGLWVAVAEGTPSPDDLPQAAEQLGACVTVPGPVNTPVPSGVVVTREPAICVMKVGTEVTPNAPYSVRWFSYDSNGFVVAGGLSPAASRVELVRANGTVTVATTVENTFAVRADSDPGKESPTGIVLKVYGLSGALLYSGPATADLATPRTRWH